MRLIDADALMDALGIAVECKDCSRKGSFGCKEDSAFVYACEAITESPAIEAVPVVRCRDCKHYKFTNDYAFGFSEKGCELTGFNDVDEDDFCSRGWRKDGKQ